MADDDNGAVFTVEFKNGASLKTSTTEVQNKIKAINKEIKTTQTNFKNIFKTLNIGSSNNMLKVFKKINEAGFKDAIASIKDFQEELVSTNAKLQQIKRLTGKMSLGGIGVGRSRRRGRGAGVSVNEALAEAKNTLTKQKGAKIVSGIRRNTSKDIQAEHKNKTLDSQTYLNTEKAKHYSSKTEKNIAKGMADLSRAINLDAKTEALKIKSELNKNKSDSIDPKVNRELKETRLEKTKAEVRLKEQQISSNEQRALIQKVKYEVFLKNQALRDKKRQTLEAQKLRESAWHRRMGRGIKGFAKRQGSNIVGAGVGFALYKAGQIIYDTTTRLGQEQAVAGQSNTNKRNILDMLNIEERGQQKAMKAVRKSNGMPFTKPSREKVSGILSNLAELTAVIQQGATNPADISALRSLTSSTGINLEGLRGKSGNYILRTLSERLLSADDKQLKASQFVSPQALGLLKQALTYGLQGKDIIDNKSSEGIKNSMNTINDLKVKTTNLVIEGLSTGFDIFDLMNHLLTNPVGTVKKGTQEYFQKHINSPVIMDTSQAIGERY